MLKKIITVLILALLFWGLSSEISRIWAKVVYIRGDTEINITRWKEIVQWNEETDEEKLSSN